MFNPEDIEDVRVIIKADGKNYAITPKKDMKEIADRIRVLLLPTVLEFHDIVEPSLEEMSINAGKKKKQIT